MANEIFKDGLIELAGQFKATEGVAVGNFVISESISVLLDLVDELKEDFVDGKLSIWEILAKADNAVAISKVVARYEDFQQDAKAIAEQEDYQDIVLKQLIDRIGGFIESDEDIKIINHGIKCICHGVFCVLGYVNKK